jgi:inorganic pyrophosphatase/exopolyphosphatase
MTHQNIRKNPFEDQIIEETAENVAEEMIAEIRDEVAVWVEKLPITSTKVRSTDITKVVQERFAQQLAERQEKTAEQIVSRRKKVFEQIPSGRVCKEILSKESQAVLEKEGDFLAHVLQ